MFEPVRRSRTLGQSTALTSLPPLPVNRKRSSYTLRNKVCQRRAIHAIAINRFDGRSHVPHPHQTNRFRKGDPTMPIKPSREDGPLSHSYLFILPFDPQIPRFTPSFFGHPALRAPSPRPYLMALFHVPAQFCSGRELMQ